MFYVIGIGVGYQKVLIHTDVMLDPNNIFAVESETVGGVRKYFVENKTDITVIAVPRSKIVFPNTEEEQKTFKALHDEVEKDRDAYRSRAWRAEEELKKAKQVINDMTKEKSNE